MSPPFNPQLYWTSRFARLGTKYVAKGGRAAEYQKEHEAVAPFLRAQAAGCQDVLDFGCGSQRFRSVLEAEGRVYTGVDLIPGLGTVELGDSLPRAAFDCAVATFVLQHVVDEAQFKFWVQELYASLTLGGRLLLVNHNAPIPKPDAHMATWGLADVLSAAPWRDHTQWGEYGPHWIGTLWK